MEFKQNALKKIDIEFGTNIESLEKCESWIFKLKEDRNRIQNSLTSADGVTSKIAETVKVIKETSKEIEHINEECRKLEKSFEKFEVKAKPVKSKLQEFIEKINLLEKTNSYLKLLKNIDNLSANIEAGISDNNERKSTINYVLLTDLSKMISKSTCRYLVTYLNDTIHYWHNILKDKLTIEYEEILKSLKWPFVGNSLFITPSIEILNKFQMLTEHLLQIQLPDHTYLKAGVSSTLLTDFTPLSLPMVLLIRPLRKRFLYHFNGSRQTNRADKPEWFFTQVLTWVKQHQDFIDANIQPSYNKIGRGVLAKHEFMIGLIQTVVEKLHSEVQCLQYDDSLFSHLVDETLGFDREMRESYGYPQSEPGVVGVLTAATTFVKWLSVEKKYALEKMDRILCSETAFTILPTSEDGQLRVTECGDSFINLLSAVTDRYKVLTQPGHRVQFLHLQLELIDDYRVRLLQLLRENDENPLSGVYVQILNTVHYVYCVLDEWGSNTHFLHLKYYKRQLENVTNGNSNTADEDFDSCSVFDEYLKLLSKMRGDILTSVCQHVLLDVKSRSRNYRNEKWFAMESTDTDPAYLNLTPSACSMFQVLSTHLHYLHQCLAYELFKQFLSSLANSLDVYLYEEVVTVNCFNKYGARQLNYDFTRNLLPLFQQYFDLPKARFPRMTESCFLLTMPRGTVLLLLETLHEKENGDYSKIETLRDLDINVLTIDECVDVINSRTDRV